MFNNHICGGCTRAGSRLAVQESVGATGIGGHSLGHGPHERQPYILGCDTRCRATMREARIARLMGLDLVVPDLGFARIVLSTQR